MERQFGAILLALRGWEALNFYSNISVIEQIV